MSIQESDIKPDLVVLKDGIETVGNPMPVDEKVMGGVALRSRLTEELLNSTVKRLNEIFTAFRADYTCEFGECIAYCLDISPEDRDLLDGTLIQTAIDQNHGMLTKESDSQHTLWRGGEGNKIFKLRKQDDAVILLDDGTLPTGTIYSLVGVDLEEKKRRSDGQSFARLLGKLFDQIDNN